MCTTVGFVLMGRIADSVLVAPSARWLPWCSKTPNLIYLLMERASDSVLMAPFGRWRPWCSRPPYLLSPLVAHNQRLHTATQEKTLLKSEAKSAAFATSWIKGQVYSIYIVSPVSLQWPLLSNSTRTVRPNH